MANITVGTTASEIPYDYENLLVVQNLGPGVVYIDSNPAVTTTNGFKIAVGAFYQFPRQMDNSAGPIYAVADQASTDVRILEV